MINALRIYAAVIIITFLIIGSLTAWLFIYKNYSPKTPLGARQVMATGIDYKESRDVVTVFSSKI